MNRGRVCKMNRKKRKLHRSLWDSRSNTIILTYGYKKKKKITNYEGSNGGRNGNIPPVKKYNNIPFNKGPNGGGDGNTPPVKKYNKITHNEGPNGGGDGNTPTVKKNNKGRIR